MCLGSATDEYQKSILTQFVIPAQAGIGLLSFK
jgi:hypothetical protein